MAAPMLTCSYTGTQLSGVSGYDSITVTFLADIAYQAFECRATKAGAAYGRGIGTLIASFSSTPAGTSRSFPIYDDYLTAGDGAYRISLYAQSADGSWNDNTCFVPSGSSGLITWDDKTFLCMN